MMYIHACMLCIIPDSMNLITFVTTHIGTVRVMPTYVTGFERTRLPRTQQEDTLFTIAR